MWCPECRASHPYNCGHKIHVDATCPICMENKRPFILLPCDHGLCEPCYLDWRERAGVRHAVAVENSTGLHQLHDHATTFTSDVRMHASVPEQTTADSTASLPQRIDAAVRRYEAARSAAATDRSARLVTAGVSQDAARTRANTERAAGTPRRPGMVRSTSGADRGQAAASQESRTPAVRRSSARQSNREGNLAESTLLFNDDGARIAFGSGPCCHKYYCGRALGRVAIPGSDGRCGPNNGPQCRSCRRVVNDEGARTTIYRIDGVVYYYCGRQATPGSNATCGPDDGQCPSCMRHQAAHVTALHESTAAH